MNKFVVLLSLLALSGCAETVRETSTTTTAQAPWQIAVQSFGPGFQREMSGLNINQQLFGESEAADYAQVSVEQFNLMDDSVIAQKTDFRLRKRNNQWIIISQINSVKCREGRGHQDFSASPCR